MSLLFLAEGADSKEPILIKVLSERFLGNTEAVRRFLEEAEIIKKANHPNIVTLYDSGSWEGGVFIAMEYIQGYSLRRILREEPLSLKRAVEILLEISYALCHLHAHHIIHRDLKPENILITHDGRLKVIDFGISQLLYEEVADDKKTPHFIGTPIYMSPEQRKAPQSVSYPSDIYSLGIIAYELILGKIIQGHIHLSLLPRGIQKIIAKTLLPDPKERYSDMVDFLSDLSDYFHSAKFLKDETPKDKALDRLSYLEEKTQSWFLPLAPSWDDLNIKRFLSKAPHFIHYDETPQAKTILFLKPEKNEVTQDLLAYPIFSAVKEALIQTDNPPKGVGGYLDFLLRVLKAWPNCPRLSFALFNLQDSTLTMTLGGDVALYLETPEKGDVLRHEAAFLPLPENTRPSTHKLVWKEGDSIILCEDSPEAPYKNPEKCRQFLAISHQNFS